jgi:predicted DNA-binding transcriptional regulator AlpA
VKTDRLISIAAFCDMLGVSRWWFYDHQGDPDVPKPVKLGKEPRLVLSECLAYVEALKSKRAPEGPPARRPGRPRRAITPPASASPRS